MVREVFVIMSKDRQFVARGTIKKRYLVHKDERSSKPFLGTTSIKVAEKWLDMSYYGRYKLGLEPDEPLRNHLMIVRVKIGILCELETK